MRTVVFQNKSYEVDSQGFLLDFTEWDQAFAEGMAPEVGIEDGLMDLHWSVINAIRQLARLTGRCPAVYQACKMNALRLRDLRELFPTGYLRGACRLAGITYSEGFVSHPWTLAEGMHPTEARAEKTYEVDSRGFLVDPDSWDEQFAIHKAHEMKIPGELTGEHMRIIRFLRERFDATGEVPTVYVTCESIGMELEELERLFPDGYHRGAVKLAGLRVR